MPGHGSLIEGELNNHRPETQLLVSNSAVPEGFQSCPPSTEPYKPSNTISILNMKANADRACSAEPHVRALQIGAGEAINLEVVKLETQWLNIELLQYELEECRDKMESQTAEIRTCNARNNMQNIKLRARQREISSLKTSIRSGEAAKIRNGQLKDERQMMELEKQAAESRLQEAELQKKTQALQWRAATAQYACDKKTWEDKYAALSSSYTVLSKELMASQRSVLVMARVRPCKGEDPHFLEISVSPRHTVSLPDRVRGPALSGRRTFEMDQVFGPCSSTETVFERIRPFLPSAFEGQALSVLADGQSNTGKSYTMFDGPGAIIKLASAEVFSAIAGFEKNRWTCDLVCSVAEVYLDNLKDLIDKPREQAKFGSLTSPTKTPPPELVARRVQSADDFLSLFQSAIGNRHQAKTAKNKMSSRGHVICKLKLTRSNPDMQPIVSRFFFVDLAGSERFNHSASAIQHQQTQFINKSRHALKTAIHTYTEGKKVHGNNQTIKVRYMTCLQLLDLF